MGGLLGGLFFNFVAFLFILFFYQKSNIRCLCLFSGANQIKRKTNIQVPPGVHLKHVKRLIINSNRAFSFLNAGVFGALFYIECFQNEINRKKSQEL